MPQRTSSLPSSPIPSSKISQETEELGQQKSGSVPNNHLVGGFNHLEKYESQWEGLSHTLWKIKHVWNHQPVIKHWSLPKKKRVCSSVFFPIFPTSQFIKILNWLVVFIKNKYVHPFAMVFQTNIRHHQPVYEKNASSWFYIYIHISIIIYIPGS